MYNPDDSPLMDSGESRKFFDAVAKRWKMLNLELGDRGFKKMLQAVTRSESSTYIAFFEFSRFILDLAKDEWMTDKMKFIIDARQGG